MNLIKHHEVFIQAGPKKLAGTLSQPEAAKGIILFAHGSGSSRHSPRNRYVANILQQAGYATLLMDLLTLEEERIDAICGRFRFDIPLLADRLLQATNWVSRAEDSHGLSMGYFGASTGAAAALIAAAEKRDLVGAVVSRGGRPDLAGRSLSLVEAPTLLIVGSLDRVVIDLNREALAVLGARPKQLEIVPGAGHLFEEPGSLERVATLACEWFTDHLRLLEENKDRRMRQPAETR